MHLGRLFTFAIMWSFGALLEIQDRSKLESYLKQSCNIDLPVIRADSQDTIFEFVVNDKGSFLLRNNKLVSYGTSCFCLAQVNGIIGKHECRTTFIQRM